MRRPGNHRSRPVAGCRCPGCCTERERNTERVRARYRRTHELTRAQVAPILQPDAMERPYVVALLAEIESMKGGAVAEPEAPVPQDGPDRRPGPVALRLDPVWGVPGLPTGSEAESPRGAAQDDETTTCDLCADQATGVACWRCGAGLRLANRKRATA